MPNTVVTSAGLDYITCASDVGTLIAIKYFVPVYDYRYDPEVITSGAYSAVSDEVEGLSAPVGEIIWNTSADDGYALLQNAILSAGDPPVGDLVTNHPWNNWPGEGVNTYNGVPLSDSYVGDSISMSGANNFVVENIQSSAGNNDPYTATNDKFFPVTDYYPVTSGGNIRGSWKCRLGKTIGKCKFNKVALYVTAFINGVQTSDPPVFFAEASIDSPIVKTDLAQQGYDDVVMDVQIDIQSVTSAFDSVFFSTSGDYWSRSPDGSLYYPEKIGVGSFEGGLENPQATAHLRRTRSTSGIPQVRIDEDYDYYATIDVSDYAFAANKLTFLDINLENANSGTSALKNLGAIRPDIDAYYYLGYDIGATTPTRRWRGAYFSHTINVGDGDGASNRVLISSASGVTLYNGTDNNLNFVGGDLYRDETELLTYTRSSSTSGKDVWAIAGVDETGTWYDNISHNEILSAATGTSPTAATYKGRFNKYASLNMLARNGANVYGYINVDSRGTPDVGTTQFDQGLVMSNQNALVLIGGLSGNIGTTLIVDKINNGLPNVFDPYLKTDARLDLISRTIYTYGNIIPWSTSAHDIGSQSRVYNNIYANSIGTVSKKISSIYGNIVYGEKISTNTTFTLNPYYTDTDGFYELSRGVPNGYWSYLPNLSYTAGSTIFGSEAIGLPSIDGTANLTVGEDNPSMSDLGQVFKKFKVYDFKYTFLGKTIILSFTIYVEFQENSNPLNDIGGSSLESFFPFNITFDPTHAGTLNAETYESYESQVCSNGNYSIETPIFIGASTPTSEENKIIFKVYSEALVTGGGFGETPDDQGSYLKFNLIRQLR